MAKINFKTLVASALKDIDSDIQAVATKAVEVASAPTAAIPSAPIAPVSMKAVGVDAQRVGERTAGRLDRSGRTHRSGTPGSIVTEGRGR